MKIEAQFHDCGCALFRDEDTNEARIQPGLGCEQDHDWGIIRAGIFDNYAPYLIDELAPGIVDLRGCPGKWEPPVDANGLWKREP